MRECVASPLLAKRDFRHSSCYVCLVSPQDPSDHSNASCSTSLTYLTNYNSVKSISGRTQAKVCIIEDHQQHSGIFASPSSRQMKISSGSYNPPYRPSRRHRMQAFQKGTKIWASYGSFPDGKVSPPEVLGRLVGQHGRLLKKMLILQEAQHRHVWPGDNDDRVSADCIDG